ncbi:hypothetical protein GM547_13500 [Streptococcus pneumoniae]|uniref:hypothetical protein n=1 Tax=Streptococcus pneumoniae TaxID=1313 RepID=UPI0012D7D68E|nr:hypothetical protein [Streptococcus pneumoniae]MTV59059.1 hypothetical protein [Streptococcus pneumoniae]
MIFDDKTDDEIFRSIEAEVAKALNELRCAKNDLAQAETRMKFALATIHYLKKRFEG